MNIENNIVVNNVIEVNYIEENTGKKVKEVEVKETDDPAAPKPPTARLPCSTEPLKADKSAKPAKLKDAGEVKQNQAENKKKVQTETEGQATLQQRKLLPLNRQPSLTTRRKK